MYTIGQVSKLFNLPISTIRYYDKVGLLPDIERSSGIRQFGEKDLEALKVIECLKKSGLEIKDIKQFIDWCKMGSSTYALRHSLFIKQRERVKKEIEQLQKTLAMLNYKCWYYEQAIKDDNESHIKELLPDHLPKAIQELYNKAFKN